MLKIVPNIFAQPCCVCGEKVQIDKGYCTMNPDKLKYGERSWVAWHWDCIPEFADDATQLIHTLEHDK